MSEQQVISSKDFIIHQGRRIHTLLFTLILYTALITLFYVLQIGDILTSGLPIWAKAIAAFMSAICVGIFFFNCMMYTTQRKRHVRMMQMLEFTAKAATTENTHEPKAEQSGEITKDLAQELIKQFEDDKAREMFNANNAKEKGERDRYLQHFWQATAYGLAAQKIEQKISEAKKW